MSYEDKVFEIRFCTFANRIAKGRNHESRKSDILLDYVAHPKI